MGVLKGKFAGRVRIDISPETVVGRFSSGVVTEITFAELAAELGSQPSVNGRVYGCPGSVLVGDPVYFTAADTVDTSRADDLAKWAYLVVISKPTATTARCAAEGIAAGIAGGLVAGSTYWVADSGGLTTSLPSSGNNLQQVGIAANVTDLEIRITPVKTVAP